MTDLGGWRDAVGVTADKPSANGNAPDLAGDELLDELVSFIRRFVVLSDEQASGDRTDTCRAQHA